MKLQLPENHSEITLGQYQEYVKLTDRTDLSEYDMLKRKLKIFTGLSYRDIGNMSRKDVHEISLQINRALTTEAEFVNRFKLGELEFGFIPNFDKITAAEWFDLTTYDVKVETLHKLMAILFRPIKRIDMLGNYKIVGYSGSADMAEVMKRTPMSVVNGALFFFTSLATELKNSILKYTAEAEAMKGAQQKNTSKNGVGFRRLTEWLKARCGGMDLLNG